MLCPFNGKLIILTSNTATIFMGVIYDFWGFCKRVRNETHRNSSNSSLMLGVAVSSIESKAIIDLGAVFYF